jgi:hypothetical protein
MDMNELRRLIQAGVISEDDLAQMPISGSMNALAQAVQPQEQPMPQPRFDIAPMAMNTMRAENGPDAGKVTSLEFNRPQPQGQPSAPQSMGQPAQPSMMDVIGSGNGTTVRLSPEQAPARVNIDYSRPQIDTMGGKAYYSKDEPGVAYVMGPNGPKAKILLGYDMQGSMALNKYNLDQVKTKQDIAASQEHVRASQVQNPDMGSMGGGAAAGLSGDELLKNLDPGTAGLVKAYAEGKMAFPGGAAMRSPRMMQLLSLVSAYDPTFDATDFNARNKTLAGFTAGKQGDAVRAVNQAIAHAGSLSDATDKLDNFNGVLTPLNAPVNAVEQMFGDSRQGNFKQNAMALSSELRKVFAGSGGGSLSELQSWESGLPLNASHDQQKAYLAKGLELLQGAIGALNSQYQRGMGPKADIMNIIDPKAQATLDRLVGGGASAAPTASAAPAAELKSPPSPAQYAGKRMQAPDGTIYKSDGNRWVRVN